MVPTASIPQRGKVFALIDIILVAHLWTAVVSVACLCLTMTTYPLTTMHVKEMCHAAPALLFNAKLGSFRGLAVAANLPTANLSNQGCTATVQRRISQTWTTHPSAFNSSALSRKAHSTSPIATRGRKVKGTWTLSLSTKLLSGAGVTQNVGKSVQVYLPRLVGW